MCGSIHPSVPVSDSLVLFLFSSFFFSGIRFPGLARRCVVLGFPAPEGRLQVCARSLEAVRDSVGRKQQGRRRVLQAVQPIGEEGGRTVNKNTQGRRYAKRNPFSHLTIPYAPTQPTSAALALT